MKIKYPYTKPQSPTPFNSNSLATFVRNCGAKPFGECLTRGFGGEVEMTHPIRGQSGHLVFSDRPQKHKRGRGRWDLASCKVPLNSIQRFQRSRKCLAQSEARVVILFCRSTTKNTNLVEDVEILFPVVLRWIGCLTSQLTIFQSYIWRHIDVQADWRRSWTYGRAPNAIDIS